MAIYFFEQDALLLLPAKCGSTSLRHAASVSGLRHALLGPRELRSHGNLAFYGQNFTTIGAFIRHPYDWHVSYWNHRTKVLGFWDAERSVVDRACGQLSFSDYMKCVYNNFPNRVERYYSSFIGPRGDRISFIGKLENLEKDFFRFASEIGASVGGELSSGITKQNVQKSKDGDEETRRLVWAHERALYEEFGYDP